MQMMLMLMVTGGLSQAEQELFLVTVKFHSAIPTPNTLLKDAKSRGPQLAEASFPEYLHIKLNCKERERTVQNIHEYN